MRIFWNSVDFDMVILGCRQYNGCSCLGRDAGLRVIHLLLHGARLFSWAETRPLVELFEIYIVNGVEYRPEHLVILLVPAFPCLQFTVCLANDLPGERFVLFHD